MRTGRHVAILGLFAVLSACANSPQQASPHEPQASAAPSPGAPVAAETGVDAAPVASATAAPTAPDAAATQPIAAAAWFAARGVTPLPERTAGELTGCAAVKVGAPPREALLCSGGPPMEGSLASGQSLFPVIIAFAESGKLEVALRVPLAAGPQDKMGPSPDDPDHGNYLQLTASLSPDGMHLSVQDRPGGGCAERLQSFRDQNRSGPLKAVLTPQIRVVEVACRSRGEYSWRGGGFSR